jgi:hypothetical protein
MQVNKSHTNNSNSLKKTVNNKSPTLSYKMVCKSQGIMGYTDDCSHCDDLKKSLDTSMCREHTSSVIILDSFDANSKPSFDDSSVCITKVDLPTKPPPVKPSSSQVVDYYSLATNNLSSRNRMSTPLLQVQREAKMAVNRMQSPCYLDKASSSQLNSPSWGNSSKVMDESDCQVLYVCVPQKVYNAPSSHVTLGLVKESKMCVIM